MFFSGGVACVFSAGGGRPLGRGRSDRGGIHAVVDGGRVGERVGLGAALGGFARSAVERGLPAGTGIPVSVALISRVNVQGKLASYKRYKYLLSKLSAFVRKEIVCRF